MIRHISDVVVKVKCYKTFKVLSIAQCLACFLPFVVCSIPECDDLVFECILLLKFIGYWDSSQNIYEIFIRASQNKSK